MQKNLKINFRSLLAAKPKELDASACKSCKSPKCSGFYIKSYDDQTDCLLCTPLEVSELV